MSRKFFGTDGVRGVANQKLTPELAMKLGQAAGIWLREIDRPLRVVVGRDTRKSGPMLGAALAAGFNSVGVNVVSLGIAPTPTVSYVARTGDFSLGVVISASHNPFPDNGIKFVGDDGRKLPDEIEHRFEQLMESEFERPLGAQVGELVQLPEQAEDYLDMLVRLIPRSTAPNELKGLKIAIDCANGAGYLLGPEALRRLGAEVFTTANDPDGININTHCGATHPDTIQKFTVQCGADLGVSFDGDADRVVFSDSKGRLINGDRTIGMWAEHELKQGRLNPAVVVGTVMTNGGFEHYAKQIGLQLERTPVGDKYVAQRIQDTSARIGGEQSGHIIFPEHGPTGDGLVTMLEILKVIVESGRSADSFYDAYEPWPQLLTNMKVADRSTWNDGELVQSTIDNAMVELAGRGRVNVRASGTQDLVRVMVEADSYELRDAVSDRIVQAIYLEAGGEVINKTDLTYALGD